MKLPSLSRVKVRRRIWRDRTTGTDIEAIQIWQGKTFIIVGIEDARILVDAVHDAADEHDREQRSKTLETQ